MKLGGYLLKSPQVIKYGLLGAAGILLVAGIYYFILFLTFPRITTYNPAELNLYTSLILQARQLVFVSVGVTTLALITFFPNFILRFIKVARASTHYDPRLAGLRGLAALGVVLLHAEFPYPFSSILDILYLGVPVFLMLSMYLLLNSLQYNSDLKHYFLRRIKRIWPIYFGVLIAAILIFRLPLSSIWEYFFFAQYFLHPLNPFGNGVLGVFWTLQLEEAAYLVIPLIARLKKVNQVRLGGIIIGLGALALFTSPVWYGYNITLNLQILAPVAITGYGFGILAYCGKIRSVLRWLVIAGFGGLIALNYINPGNYADGSVISVETVGSIHPVFFIQAILYMVSLIGLCGLVAFPPVFLSAFLMLGEESYALYAIHMTFLTLFGFEGIILALIVAFGIEFLLRPKDILGRIKANEVFQKSLVPVETPLLKTTS